MAVFLLVTVVGCHDGECVPAEGREFDALAAKRVRVGDTDAQVRALLGPPVQVIRKDTYCVSWRYYCRYRRSSWIEVAGVRIPDGGAWVRSEAVYQLQHGLVSRVEKLDPWAYE